MATSNANAAIEEIDDAPTIQEFDDSSAGGITEFDDAVAQAAQNSATVAQQALDVATLPAKMDWSAANEHLDSQRFADILALNEQAGQIEAKDPSQLYNTRGEAAKLRTKAFDLQQQMSDTQAGRDAASLERENRLRSMGTPYAPHETLPTFTGLNGRTPSEALSSFLGPGLSTTAQPVTEGAARNLGGATGGALGAALGAAATAGTGGLFPLAYGIGGAILGSFAGNEAQEKILQTTETPEETQARQQRAANDFAANPGLTKLGAMAAALPFFGPGLAQFGLAAAGDRGAIVNLGLGGTINAATEAGMAKLRGESAKPEDIAEAFFSGMVLNEPTRLGRKLGLHPSSEQVAREAAQAKYAELAKAEPIGPQDTLPSTPTGEPNAQQISEASPLNGGVRPPEVPQQNAELPPTEGSQGVQPSGQGGPLAENAPKAPREVAPLPPSVDVRKSKIISEANSEASDKLNQFIEDGIFKGSQVDKNTIITKPQASDPEGTLFRVTKLDDSGSPLSHATISETEYADFYSSLDKTSFRDSPLYDLWRKTKQSLRPDTKNIMFFGKAPVEFTYRLRLREYGPGAAPSEGLIRAEGRDVTYDHPLTREEMKQIEADPISSQREVTTGSNLTPESGIAPREVSDAERVAKLVEAGMSPEDAAAGLAKVKAAEAPPVGGPGAMGPTEAAEMQAAGKTTGLKRSIVDTERLDRGAEEIPTPERLKRDAIMRNAEDAVDADPSLAPSIVSRVVDAGQQAITHQEAGALLVERVRLSNEVAAWEERKASGEDPAVADAQLAELERQTERLDRAQRAAGSEWSDVGRMYQNQLREDFTLDALKRKARAAKQGPLTPEESTKITEQAKQIKELQEKVDAGAKAEQTARETEAVNHTLQATIKDLQADHPKFGKQVFEIAHKIVDRWKADAELARKSLRSRLANANIPLADLGVILDVARVARAKIGEFGLNFAETSAELIAELGEGVRPYLQKAWDKAQQLIDREASGKTREVVKAGVRKKGELSTQDALNRAKADAAAGDDLQSRTVYDVARSHINAGVHGEAAVMKATHETLKEVYPEVTERDVRRAFSEYGKVKFPSKEATAVELRELRTLVRLQESIDRETEGLSALHTGLQRDKATQSIREKQAQLNELLKKRQGSPSPEQLATRDEARKTALRNQIADLDKQLQTGEKPIKGQPAPLSTEAEALVSLRDAMREKLREIEKSEAPQKTAAEKQIEALSKQRQRVDDLLSGKETPKTPKEWEALSPKAADLKSEILAMQELAAQMRRDAKPKSDPNAAKEQAQIKALEAAIKNYEAKTAAGDFSAEGRLASRPDTEKVAALRAIRDARKAAYDAAKKAGAPVRTPEQVYNDTRLKSVHKQIAAAEAMLKSGKFEKAPKATPPQKNAEVRAAEVKLAEKKLEVRRGFEKQRLENRTRTEKILDGIVKWRRTFVLTSPVTLAKLTSAAGEIMAVAPVEEAIGGVLSKIPGLRGIAEKAPRHGQFSWQAEGRAIAETWRNLLTDAGKAWKTGHTELDLLYGKPTITPPELKDFVGHLHVALKSPAKRNEFVRSLEKLTIRAARAGLDVRDPVVQTNLATKAYKDAQKSVFGQDNRVVSAYKRALTAFEQLSKETGKPSLLGKAAAFGLKYTLPIVRIPTNIVARTFEYSLGTAAGSARIARAMWHGLDNLSETEAEHIMSNLKRGSLGLAVMALGFFNPRNVGGYYQREEQRSKGDVKPGELKIGGVTVPGYLIHNPLLEQLQIGATIRRVMDSRLRKHGDPQGLGAGVMAAAAGVLEETPFIREMEDTLKVLNPRERQTFLTELVQSASPQIVQWAAKQLDKDSQGEPVRRKPETLLQSIEMVTPGLRSNVPRRK